MTFEHPARSRGTRSRASLAPDADRRTLPVRALPESACRGSPDSWRWPVRGSCRAHPMKSTGNPSPGHASPCVPVAAPTPMPRPQASARTMRARHRASLALLLLTGLVAVSYYFSWWFEDARTGSALHVVAFVAAALYQGMQLFLCWFLYWKAEGRRATPIPPASSPEQLVATPEVDVFVPVYREPHHVVEAALRAARDMELPHRTVLLDDDRDPAMRALAAELGVDYRVRIGNKDAKAGNVNAALAESTAEIVVIFDVDH